MPTQGASILLKPEIHEPDSCSITHFLFVSFYSLKFEITKVGDDNRAGAFPASLIKQEKLTLYNQLMPPDLLHLLQNTFD